MTRSEKHQNRIVRVLAVLICLAVVALCAIGGSVARYRSSASGASSATVALWSGSQTITLPEGTVKSLVPGSSFTYTLNVTNVSDGKTSEVSQTYYIQVETAGNLPLNFTLKRGDETVTLKKGAGQDAYVGQDEQMKFTAGMAGTHTYTLTVSWLKDYNRASLAGVPDYVQINVCAQQAD